MKLNICFAASFLVASSYSMLRPLIVRAGISGLRVVTSSPLPDATDLCADIEMCDLVGVVLPGTPREGEDSVVAFPIPEFTNALPVLHVEVLGAAPRPLVFDPDPLEYPRDSFWIISSVVGFVMAVGVVGLVVYLLQQHMSH
jgi:hypothetical protein